MVCWKLCWWGQDVEGGVSCLDCWALSAVGYDVIVVGYMEYLVWLVPVGRLRRKVGAVLNNVNTVLYVFRTRFKL